MLRVLTLNIWNLGGDWRARRQAILAVIRDGEADVVCLQEVVEAHDKNQAEWLARELGDWSWTWAGEPGYGLADMRFGNAVLALMAFVSARTDPDAEVGPVVAGDFNAEPDSSAIRYLSGLAPLDGSSTYLQDAWRLAGDGGPGLTWSNDNPHAALDAEPERRLDYVFSGFHGRSGLGRPLECRVVAHKPVDGTWPTDHYGVLAVLQT